MTDGEDRIPVPTNGHRPPLSSDDETPPAAPVPPAPPAPPGGEVVDEPRVSVSPGQVAAGFGIIAALILLVARRRRGKRG